MKTYITKTELASRLGRSENTISRWIQQGCPHITKVCAGRGRAVRPLLNEKDVKAWLLDKYQRKEFDV